MILNNTNKPSEYTEEQCELKRLAPVTGGNQSGMFECLPIGMAYVPWQRWNKVYQEDVALNRGTIFPELDLPFLGEEVM